MSLTQYCITPLNFDQNSTIPTLWLSATSFTRQSVCTLYALIGVCGVREERSLIGIFPPNPPPTFPKSDGCAARTQQFDLSPFPTNPPACQVFEYLDQDLKHFLGHVIGPVPLPLVASYTRQLLAAVAYCHSHRILVRGMV